MKNAFIYAASLFCFTMLLACSGAEDDKNEPHGYKTTDTTKVETKNNPVLDSVRDSMMINSQDEMKRY